MRLLCLSNGHGEDTIALRILQALQQHPQAPTLAALPIVGEGHAYTQAGIPLIGSVKAMPSGGFIYMDGRQLARDLQGGLLQLTLAQWRAVRDWGKAAEGSPSLILAVGDIVPLLFARLSGLPYAFIGTAKSEYYIRDESGLLPRPSWWVDRLERWTGCIYHPWERWLMGHPHCKAVFPRDRITAAVLQKFGIPAFDLGNPMMDGLSWAPEHGAASRLPEPSWEKIPSSGAPEAEGSPTTRFTLALLPGSRPPEAYANWETLLLAVNGLLAQLQNSFLFLAAISPGLEVAQFHQTLVGYRWQQVGADTYTIGVGERRATLVLAQNRFAECLHRADMAIAMAGTATEQFVGLGKPAITIPGQGPQFTPAFAEAQTRLLGASVTLVPDPAQVAGAIRSLLANPDRLHWIAENGHRRMGEPGAAARIADRLMACLES